TVDVGSDDAPVGRYRPLGCSVGEASKRPRTVWPFGHTHMHFVTRKGRAVVGLAVHPLEALVRGQNRLDIEQTETIGNTNMPLDPERVPYRASQHLISATQP